MIDLAGVSRPSLTAAEAAALRAGATIPNLRRILALGTSITNKWGGANAAGSIRSVAGDSYLYHFLVATGWPAESVINAGVSGNTTAQMLARHESDVVAKYALFDTLVFEPGPNDYQTGSVPAASILDDCRVIMDSAINAGKFVYLLTTTPSESWNAAGEAIAQEVRRSLFALYGAHRQVVIVDVFSALSDATTGRPISEFFMPISIEALRVHLSISGAQMIGRLLAAATPAVRGWSRVRPRGQRDHYEILPNPKLAGSNASGSRNFYAGAGVTVAGGPDSCAIAIATGTFSSISIATAAPTGADVFHSFGGVRITTGGASDRARWVLRVGSGDAAVGGTQWGRWDSNLANATYVIGDHARLAASPLGILECIVGGATGTASATAPAAYGQTLVIGAATFIWKKLPAAGDIVVPEVEYEIESQTGGVYLRVGLSMYRTPDGSVGERWADSTAGEVDFSATLTQGPAGIWAPKRGVIRGLPVTLANPGVSLRHVFIDIAAMHAASAAATLRIINASARLIA